VLPGGETRSIAHYPPYPVVLRGGEGPLVYDIDGNEYVDVLNNYTALVHGHAHPRLTAAIQESASLGTVFPAPHESQLELASLLAGRLPAAEQVRFTNSGSEAAILGARVARHVTGRRRILLFEGGYHGTGIPFAEAEPDVARVPFNDVRAVRDVLDETFAAVFVEPFLGSGGVIPASEEFLAAVGEAAQACGSLFVVDEIQALRCHLNGTHSSLPHEPDLVLLGKVIGGGLPVGAIAGRADLLACLAADAPSRLTHSGTFNGNVLAMRAGVESMKLLDASAINALNTRGRQIAEAITEAGRRHDLPISVTRSGSILHVHFLTTTPTNYQEANAAPEVPTHLLHLALLLNGVYAAPRGMLNLSTVLTDETVARVETGYDRALAAVAKEWEQT
jgi:glutamate-1-semialdehyde 2,1-aminomutase